jgi:stress-induced morphogen
MDNLEKKNRKYEKSSDEEDSSEEDSDSETDKEEYKYVACKQYFLGENMLEQHRKIYQHWG